MLTPALACTPSGTAPTFTCGFLDQLEEMVMVFTREMQFVFINRAAEQIIGRIREELEHQHRDEIGLPVSEAFREAFWRTVATGEPQIYEAWAPALERLYRNRLYVDGDHVWVVSQDVTEKRALAKERERLFEELSETLALRDEFLTIASHELKTPLTPLSLKLQVLVRLARKHEGSDFAAEVHQYALEMVKQVGRLDALVGELLDVSRIMGGRLTHSPEPLDLAEVVQEVIERHREQAERAQVELRAVVEPAAGEWDRLRLEQVITHLLANALKFGEGHPVEVRTERAGAEAVLQVRDQGIGISPEDQRRIFERFERAAHRNYGGLGLGLYFARNIVEAMGGTIRVESARGEGSTFFVTLPLQPASASVAG
jgi:signal transduction histidine kinase